MDYFLIFKYFIVPIVIIIIIVFIIVAIVFKILIVITYRMNLYLKCLIKFMGMGGKKKISLSLIKCFIKNREILKFIIYYSVFIKVCTSFKVHLLLQVNFL